MKTHIGEGTCNAAGRSTNESSFKNREVLEEGLDSRGASGGWFQPILRTGFRNFRVLDLGLKRNGGGGEPKMGICAAAEAGAAVLSGGEKERVEVGEEGIEI